MWTAHMNSDRDHPGRRQPQIRVQLELQFGLSIRLPFRLQLAAHQHVPNIMTPPMDDSNALRQERAVLLGLSMHRVAHKPPLMGPSSQHAPYTTTH